MATGHWELSLSERVVLDFKKTSRQKFVSQKSGFGLFLSMFRCIWKTDTDPNALSITLFASMEEDSNGIMTPQNEQRKNQNKNASCIDRPICFSPASHANYLPSKKNLAVAQKMTTSHSHLRAKGKGVIAFSYRIDSTHQHFTRCNTGF